MSPTLTPRLLVSVRNVAEMQGALAGGADILDVKEPARGALGRADAETLSAIATRARQANVEALSAALGELLDFDIGDVSRLPSDFRFLKLGTAGLARVPQAKSDFIRAANRIRASIGESVFVVPAAYADWPRAAAPTPLDVLHWAVDAGSKFLLVDTFVKDGRGFWEHTSKSDFEYLLDQCRRTGLQLAIAGSLDAAGIARFQGAPPDVLGVRGAACAGGARDRAIDADRVRRLKAAVGSLCFDVV